MPRWAAPTRRNRETFRSAHWWQAARPLGDYALVGCTVGPGFDFADFVLMSDLPAAERPAPPAGIGAPEFLGLCGRMEP